MTKEKILQVFCDSHCPDCATNNYEYKERCRASHPCLRYTELSNMLSQYRAAVIESVPCEKIIRAVESKEDTWSDKGYNEHVAEVEAWKKQMGEK